MPGDENDTVGDQLARRRDALLAVAVIVDQDHFDRLAEETAGLVELGHGHRDAPFVLLAEPRHGSGQRRRRPDPDPRRAPMTLTAKPIASPAPSNMRILTMIHLPATNRSGPSARTCRRSRRTMRERVEAGDVALVVEADLAQHGIELLLAQRSGDLSPIRRARLLDRLRPRLDGGIGEQLGG